MNKLELPLTAESFLSHYVALFNERDIDRLVAMYETDAVLHLQEGYVARGHAEIRSALLNFLASETPMRIERGFCLVTGDDALVASHWYLDGKAPDGSVLAMEGKNCDVIRRGPDGFWRLRIDNPFGTAAI